VAIGPQSSDQHLARVAVQHLNLKLQDLSTLSLSWKHDLIKVRNQIEARSASITKILGQSMAAVLVQPEGVKRERPAGMEDGPAKVGGNERLLVLQYLIQNLLMTGFPFHDTGRLMGITVVDVLAKLDLMGFDRKFVKDAVELKDFHVNDTAYHLFNSAKFRAEKASDVYNIFDHILYSTTSHGNLLRNGEVTCIYPECKRSQHFHGFYSVLTQQQHLTRVHGWDRERDILRGLVVDSDGNVTDVGGIVLAQISELFENVDVDGFVGGSIGESGLVTDAEGLAVCMVQLTNEGVKRQQSVLGQKSEVTGAEESSQEHTAHNDPEEQEQRMYMHYTISRDMTGSNDEVAAKLLAALGERSRETRFKDLEEPKDDIAAKLLPALGGSGRESRFKNADLTLLGSKGRLR
jgi:hypothetical protein